MSSLKPLKSVAHDVSHPFASTLNHREGDCGINVLARSVYAAGNDIAVDLLAGSSEPSSLWCKTCRIDFKHDLASDVGLRELWQESDTFSDGQNEVADLRKRLRSRQFVHVH